MNTITNKEKIDQVLERGVSEVIGTDHLSKRLQSGEVLRIKLGIDPTSPDLHLGRAVPLLKLRDFQELGHQIIFLVGNATGVIGDTSDKESERPMLTHEDVKANMESYIKQAGKIIDIEKTEIVYNADWLDKLGYKEIGHHADAFSLHEFIQRDNIKKRLDAGKRVSLRELLYPLMQGYDSVAVRADVELGGTDQRFNLLAGRVLQEQAGQEPQDIIMGNLILGTDGRKMSSSWGNTIKLTDAARDMGEKIMNMPDDIVPIYFENCTRVPQAEVDTILAQDDQRLQKVALAKAVIELYHSSKVAQAEADFLKEKFIDKNDSALDVLNIHPDQPLIDFIFLAGAAKSKSDARRMIEQGGVTIRDEKGKMKPHIYHVFSSEDHGKTLQVGKKFIVNLNFTLSTD